MKSRLNQKLADHLPPIPEGKKSVEYRDIDMPGFLIAQYHTNPEVATYTLRYRDENGKQRALKIGRTDEISLKQAKAIAKTKKSEIALGGDPSGEIEKKRGELTYAEAMEQYYLPDIEQRLRRPEYYRQLYENRLKSEFGKKKISSITRADVQAFINRMKQEGNSGSYCNRHAAVMKSSYNYFIHILEVAIIRNPVKGVKYFEEVARDRILSQEELYRLMPVLMNAEKEYSQPARIIRMILASALRPGECFNIRWEDIDLENKRLYIHSSVSKNKKSDAIPLNDAAIQVLSECPRDKPWPLCNLSTDKPYTSIKKAFRTLLMSRAGIEGMTLHRCRATSLSIAINSGHSIFEAMKLARHKNISTTEKHYARLTTQTLQKASDSISDQLLKAALGAN